MAALAPFVFSIRPPYVAMFFDGRKRFEFRTRRPSVEAGDTVLVYETAPTSAVVATAVVGIVYSGSRWGVPQRRHRLIVVGHLDRELRIAEPDVRPEDEPTLESVLDFDVGEWTSIRKITKPGAHRRAAHAHKEFGGGPCWGFHASHQRAWARSVHEPANTITTQNQHYLVRDGEYRLWSVPETSQVMGFKPSYFDGVDRTAALVLAGNAVPPPMAAGILRQVAATV